MTHPLPVSTAPSSWSGSLADAARELASTAEALGDARWASTIRTWCVPLLFHGMEDAFKQASDPAPLLESLFKRATSFVTASKALGMVSFPRREGPTTESVEKTTGEHYGRLFREFTVESFAAEPARLLKERLERNDVRVPELKTARVLDAGCGGGRYSLAWHLLGAHEVLGVDLSEPGIADARRRVEAMNVSGVRFEHKDVVELDVDADSFDIVFSNGVLHHTRDWSRGIERLVRALRPGGLGWLYLIESPGGYFWDVIELLRDIMRNEIHEDARRVVADLGVPANRVFYMLDHVMVPINLRLTGDEIAEALRRAGAREIERLARGADFDRVERIFQNDPYAREKYGVGEHRFRFSK